MALDYDIIFNNQSEFNFIDNSNPSDYTGLGTVDKTRLEITYPPILDVDLVELQLFNENISTLTDNFLVNVDNFVDLNTLVDGVYRFNLTIYDSNPTLLGSKEEYFVQDYSIKQCIKSQVEKALDQEPKSWCNISRMNAILNSAHFCASQGEWENAQNIIAFLTKECEKLNCLC
jgi:hypothetical protein